MIYIMILYNLLILEESSLKILIIEIPKNFVLNIFDSKSEKMKKNKSWKSFQWINNGEIWRININFKNSWGWNGPKDSSILGLVYSNLNFKLTNILAAELNGDGKHIIGSRNVFWINGNGGVISWCDAGTKDTIAVGGALRR